MWKSLYQRMARSHKDPEFKFMNYGFKDNYPPTLSPEDEPNRIFIQLYHMNVRDTDLEGKEILEIGGSRDFMQGFKNFRGRAPSLDTLLIQNGITV